eukprot:3315362-Rhodomonas_salina.8
MVPSPPSLSYALTGYAMSGTELGRTALKQVVNWSVLFYPLFQIYFGSKYGPTPSLVRAGSSMAQILPPVPQTHRGAAPERPYEYAGTLSAYARATRYPILTCCYLPVHVLRLRGVQY